VQQSIVSLRFPSGGLVKGTAFRSFAPYTTPSALNVWPIDPFEERRRGGSRPGISKVYTDHLAGPVNMIAELGKQVCVAAAGTFYRDVAGSLTSLSGATLASGTGLSSCYHLKDLIICGDTGNAASPRPLVYNGTTLSLLTASAGSVPTKVSSCCSVFDRVMFAEDADNPQEWYMSAMGDHTDFDYSVGGPGSAVVGADSEAGKFAEPCTALAPWADDCVVIGCESSLWILRGDPSYGGRMACLDHNIGIIHRNAWCRARLARETTGEGALVFLSRDGLYCAPAGCGGPVISLSRERLPQELVNIDTSLVEPILSYNHRYRGIEIWLSPKSAGTGVQHWWYDITDGGFWPMTLPSAKEPTFAFPCKHVVRDGSVSYLGCRDGYVRVFDDANDDDDGTAFDSHVDYGPIKIAKYRYARGKITSIQIDPAIDGAGVRYAIRSGSTSEGAFYETALDSGSFDGVGYKHLCFGSAGGWAFVRVSNGVAKRAWAVEDVSIEVHLSGKGAAIK